jgi:hypothetical protein
MNTDCGDTSGKVIDAEPLVDQPWVFLLHGELSDMTLACSCLHSDPDSIFSSLSDYGSRFVAKFKPPVLASDTLIFAGHCAQPHESKAQNQKETL